MDLTHRLRITLAGFIALAAVASIALADTVTAGDPSDQLLPDLRTVTPGNPSLELHVKNDGSRAILRISNKVANQGKGPLELYSQDATGDCAGDRDANQRIYEDSDESGDYSTDDQVSEEVKVGCFEYHDAPGHDHWHFRDFSKFSLASLETGQPINGTAARKIGFCIFDGYRKYTGPGTADRPSYSGGGCNSGNPAVGPQRMGLSSGWADLYTLWLPGQVLDVTDVPKGKYCLVSTANPPNGASDIREANDDNNTRSRQIRFDPARERVRWLRAACPA